EIMAITLAAVPSGSMFTQALILAVVGLGIKVLVYGGVALIVKADDLGLMLARVQTASAMGAFLRSIGKGLVQGLPSF
ncbi:DUF808 family protein, partial [Rhizobium johnstonii]|uniref:DUF808 family protein n=1 Tax=Rhizobium johnstonii TaxID=3019933 RepID=UPI003F9850A6